MADDSSVPNQGESTDGEDHEVIQSGPIGELLQPLVAVATATPEVQERILQLMHVRIRTSEEENIPTLQLSPEDVSTVVNSIWVVQEKNKHEDGISRRRYYFAAFVVALVFIGFVTYLLLSYTKEIMGEIVKVSSIFGGGFGVGFGIGRKRKKKRKK